MDQNSKRLSGLDVARFVALIGIVNFGLVLVPSQTNNGVSLGSGSSFPPFDMSHLLQGRAAALFVILAGIGFGLNVARKPWGFIQNQTIKRALFLFILGLLNSLIFPADILHYYAFYFLFSLLLVRLRSFLLWAVITVLVIGFVGLVMVFNFETGWDWKTLNYDGFWTLHGFARNLFFNGWHPVVPWFAFFIFGIWLSRQGLAKTATHYKLIVGGIVVYALSTCSAKALENWAKNIDPNGEFSLLFATSPVPPFPFYMLCGAAFSCVVIGLCLSGEALLQRLKIMSALTKAGRQSLSLYLAHIIIGMGLAQAMRWEGALTSQQSLLYSAVFCMAAIVYAQVWSRWFAYGPFEALMRKLT